ncbi:MAG: hypothetical protein ACRERE_04135 [Candidatus Entotheonellia bacterium]
MAEPSQLAGTSPHLVSIGWLTIAHGSAHATILQCANPIEISPWDTPLGHLHG